MPSGIRLMDAGAGLVVAEVVLALCVTGGPVQIGTAEEERRRRGANKNPKAGKLTSLQQQKKILGSHKCSLQRFHFTKF